MWRNNLWTGKLQTGKTKNDRHKARYLREHSLKQSL
jgi:hypothetical protein